MDTKYKIDCKKTFLEQMKDQYKEMTFVTGTGAITCGTCNITISGDQELKHKPGCKGILLVRPNNLPPDLETRMVDGVAMTIKI